MVSEPFPFTCVDDVPREIIKKTAHRSFAVFEQLRWNPYARDVAWCDVPPFDPFVDVQPNPDSPCIRFQVLDK